MKLYHLTGWHALIGQAGCAAMRAAIHSAADDADVDVNEFAEPGSILAEGCIKPMRDRLWGHDLPPCVWLSRNPNMKLDCSSYSDLRLTVVVPSADRQLLNWTKLYRKTFGVAFEIDERKARGKANADLLLREADRWYVYFGLEGRRRVMIGVAGAVAEYVWNGERDDLRDEEGWWDTAIMSPTDWLDAGVGPGDEPFGITRGPGAAFFRTINKVIHLLEGPLRAELFATSRRLIVASRWTTSRAPRRHRHRDRQGARANAHPAHHRRVTAAAARRRDRRGGVTGEFSKLASLGRSGEFRTLLADSGRFLGPPPRV